jgi:hypothetical protein
LGKPTENTKVSENTAEEGFEHGGGETVLSPLTYEGRGGGNPNSPSITGVNPNPHSEEPIEPKDPMGILSTITGGATGRGKRGGAYGK